MYDIKELEDQWKRYNRKKMRPWILVGVLLTGVIIAVIMARQGILDGIKSSFSEKKEQASVLQKPLVDVYLAPPIERLEVKSQEARVESPIGLDTRTSSDMVEEQMSQKKNALHIEVIETKKNTDAYKEVEKRFRLGHDPDDSLFLAKAYYLKGMYKKAEYWALQTNKINENIEESWLIFVKAKVKRGQRNEAIRILNTYIRKTNSAEGRILLDKIKKGNI